ncbi:DMT family transporter [Rickettsiales bacterium]|nr:DMT family transporter [Rickettsiales bacterium]
MNRQNIGIIWFLAHCLLFAIISVISKELLETLHVSQIIAIETTAASILMIPIIIMFFKGSVKNAFSKSHIIRAAFWVMGSSLYFYSITQIPIPKAVAISFAVPLFTTIMAVIFLNETLHKHRSAGLIVGFIGMLIIIQPGFADFEFASLFVIAASFLWSITDIIIKVLGKTHHAVTNTFYFSIFGALFSLPIAVTFWVTPTLFQWMLLIIIAILFIINMICVSKAYENADLTIMMPFAFSQLIFIAILSYFVFGEIVSLETAIGSLVIISSTSYISYRERKVHGHFLAPKIAEELNLDES